MYLKENIKSLFQMDTLLASSDGLNLRVYMCEKHGWDDAQWREYNNLYKGYLLEDNIVGAQANKPKLLYKDNDIVAIIFDVQVKSLCTIHG